MRVCIAQNVSLSDHLALSTFLRSISKYIAEQKDIELILLPLKGASPPDKISRNIEIHEIEGDLYSIKGNIQYSYNLYKKLNELSKEKPIDLIHCLYPNSSLSGAVLFKRKSPSTKIIYDIRSPWIEMSIEKGSIPKFIIPVYRKLAYLSERILTKYVDGFIFITEGLKKFYLELINLDNRPSPVIPSGVDLSLFSKKDPSIIRNSHNISEDDFLVGYVGVISHERKLNFLIHAFSELRRGDGKYKLMFVGDGDDKERLKVLTKHLSIDDKVIFTGKVPHEEVPNYISAFDVGLCHLPDKLVFRYSFPMKILEYLACGTPVLASDIEAHREVVRKINCIYIYKDKMSFSDLVVKIKQFDNFDNNFENIRNYNWLRISQSIVTLWRTCL